jgi:hypothetical protein
MMSVGEECRERIAGMPDRIGPRHRDGVEAERARFVDQRRLERGRIGQKSRSA